MKFARDYGWSYKRNQVGIKVALSQYYNCDIFISYERDTMTLYFPYFLLDGNNFANEWSSIPILKPTTAKQGALLLDDVPNYLPVTTTLSIYENLRL